MIYEKFHTSNKFLGDDCVVSRRRRALSLPLPGGREREGRGFPAAAAAAGTAFESPLPRARLAAGSALRRVEGDGGVQLTCFNIAAPDTGLVICLANRAGYRLDNLSC